MTCGLAPHKRWRSALRFPLLRVATPVEFLKEMKSMSALTLRLPDHKHERLKAMAEQRGISLARLLDELTTQALVEFDTETRFIARAARQQSP